MHRCVAKRWKFWLLRNCVCGLPWPCLEIRISQSAQ